MKALRTDAPDLRHVAYRGSQPAIMDLVGGQLAAVSGPLGEFLQHLQGGKVRLLATSGATRSKFAPTIPTYKEQGFADLPFDEWFGIFGPAKMSPELVSRVNADLRTALSSQEMIDGLATMAIEATPTQPQELQARLKQDLERWGPLVKRIGFTVD